MFTFRFAPIGAKRRDHYLPDDELYGEPHDDDDLHVVEGVLRLPLVLGNGGEHAQAQAAEHGQEAERIERKQAELNKKTCKNCALP